MTSVNGDFDERLRRALHAEVDSVEPAADGLERILHRTRQPWLQRQLSLMLTECADLFWLIAFGLGPVASKLRQAIAGRSGRSGRLAAPAGRRHASPGRRARPMSPLAWLRPALAVSAAVIVVVAGVYGLAQLRQSLVLDLFPDAGTSAGTGPVTNGQPGGLVQGHASHRGLLPPTSGPVPATPSASATCTKAAKKKHGRAPSSTPTPTPTGTSTGTPTPTPTPSPTSTSTATTAAFIATTSDGSLAGHCTSAR